MKEFELHSGNDHHRLQNNSPGFETWLRAKKRFIRTLEFTAWKFCVPDEARDIAKGQWFWGEGWNNLRWPAVMVWVWYNPWANIEKRIGPDGNICERNMELVLEDGGFVEPHESLDATEEDWASLEPHPRWHATSSYVV